MTTTCSPTHRPSARKGPRHRHAGDPPGAIGPDRSRQLLARAGRGLWRLFTSVDFAVIQIIALALLAVVGMTLAQLPSSAFRSAGDYAAGMDVIHARYDTVLGPGIVDVLERLGAFAIFRSPWFSLGLLVLVISIIVCTLDRTPRLWRTVSDIRVVQPEPYYDPTLPDRAAMDGVAAADLATVVGKRGFRVRQETTEDGTVHVYGDRHQYTKMATLFTHLGLILFLVAAGVTSRFGDEQGLVVPEGESLTVQPIGTPGLLLVKNLGFEAPGFATGTAHRLHDGPRGLPRRPGDRPQDDPGQRPALDRWLHVPPERVRGRAAPRRSRRGRQAVVGRPGAPYGPGRRVARTASSRCRAVTSACSCCSAASRTAPAWCSYCRTGSWARTPRAIPIPENFDPVDAPGRRHQAVRAARDLHQPDRVR